MSDLRSVLKQELHRFQGIGQAPSPIDLKGILYEKGLDVKLAGVIRMLQLILEENVELEDLIEQIFQKVNDSRDLNYRFGECNCWSCRGYFHFVIGQDGVSVIAGDGEVVIEISRNHAWSPKPAQA